MPQMQQMPQLPQLPQPQRYNLRSGTNRLVDQLKDREQPMHFRDFENDEEEAETSQVIVNRPEEYHYRAPTNIFEGQQDINIFHKNIPKQRDLDRMSKLIKQRIITDTYLTFTKAQLAREQASDPFFKPIINWLKYNHLPERKEQQRKVMTMSEDFVMADDILYKLKFNNKREDGTLEDFRVVVCVPESQEKAIFNLAHEGLMASHMGIQKTFLTLKNQYYIHGLLKKFVHYIRSCVNCQCRKTSKDVDRPWEVNIPLSFSPFQVLYADLKVLASALLIGTASIYLVMSQQITNK